MPKRASLRCYFGCVTKGPFHQFPKPEYPNLERFNSWKTVLSESVKQKGDAYIYNSIGLCGSHFESYFRLPSRRLTKNAIPTLNLTTTSQSAVLPEINEIVESKYVQEELQSETKSTAGSTHQQIEIEICGGAMTMNKDLNLTTVPAKGYPIQGSTYQQIEIEICGSATNMNKDLNETSVPAQSSLPKAQKQRHTCKEVRKLSLQVQKLKAKCKALKQQVRQAKKLSLNQAFLKGVQALPEAAQIFTNMQISKTLKKSQGRRFTKQEKILSLAIYKESEKTYELLEKLFTLPSKRTLQRMLSEEKVTKMLKKDLGENDFLGTDMVPITEAQFTEAYLSV